MSSTPPPVRYLVLWLTTACNLRCAYCYRGDQEPEVMPLDVASAALQIAAASGLPFHVQLAGGEPTLEPALIEKVARMVREAGWPATLAVQTNGTLIDPALIACWRRYGISVGLSVDGPPAVQDRVRGGARATFQGLELLARSDVAVRVTSVVSSANVHHLGELMLTLAAFPNIRGVGLDPVVFRGRAVQMEGAIPGEEALQSGIRTMLAVHDRLGKLRRTPMRWRERDAVLKALSGKNAQGVFCHACRGESMAVHPNGTVTPCGQTVSDSGKVAGTVWNVDWEKLRGTYREARMQGPCQGCFLEGRCPGDCPSRTEANQGRGPSAMCVIYRTIGEWIR